MARSRATIPSVSSCEHDLTKLIAGIASRACKIFGVKVEHIHVDTTSFSVSGQHLREPEETSDTYATVIATTYGYSCDHREDLKQWMLALARIHEGDIPTLMQPLDGNISDKASLLDTISAIQRQLQETAKFEKRYTGCLVGKISWLRRLGPRQR